MRAIPTKQISSSKMSVSARICARDIGCMQPMMWQVYGKSNQISTSKFFFCYHMNEILTYESSLLVVL